MGWPEIILCSLLVLAFFSAVFDKEQDRRNFWVMLAATIGMHALFWWGGYYVAVPAVLAGTTPWVQIWPQLGMIALSLVRLVRSGIIHGSLSNPGSPVRFLVGATPYVTLLIIGGFFD